jgi:hypothetical protein
VHYWRNIQRSKTNGLVLPVKWPRQLVTTT